MTGDSRQRRISSIFFFGVGKQTRSVVGNNVTERKNISQGGQKRGTAMVVIWRFSSYDLDVGCNYTGLGRWSWILVGSEGKKTRIIVAY